MTVQYNRAALDAELIRDEDLRLRAYKDTATPPRWTIGVGRNLTDVGFYPEEVAAFGLTVQRAIAIGITRVQAIAMLHNDEMRCEKVLDSKLPWWRDLSDVRQRVIMNMTFNLGIDGLLAFKNTLMAIQKGAYATAAASMLNSKWASQVHDRAQRLADMMRTGEAV